MPELHESWHWEPQQKLLKLKTCFFLLCSLCSRNQTLEAHQTLVLSVPFCDAQTSSSSPLLSPPSEVSSVLTSLLTHPSPGIPSTQQLAPKEDWSLTSRVTSAQEKHLLQSQTRPERPGGAVVRRSPIPTCTCAHVHPCRSYTCTHSYRCIHTCTQCTRECSHTRSHLTGVHAHVTHGHKEHVHACTHTHTKPPKQQAEPTELNKQFFLVSTGENDYLLLRVQSLSLRNSISRATVGKDPQ